MSMIISIAILFICNFERNLSHLRLSTIQPSLNIRQIKSFPVYRYKYFIISLLKCFDFFHWQGWYLRSKKSNCLILVRLYRRHRFVWRNAFLGVDIFLYGNSDLQYHTIDKNIPLYTGSGLTFMFLKRMISNRLFSFNENSIIDPLVLFLK